MAQIAQELEQYNNEPKWISSSASSLAKNPTTFFKSEVAAQEIADLSLCQSKQ